MDPQQLLEEVEKLTADLARAEMLIGSIYQICPKDTTAECHILDLIGVYYRSKEATIKEVK